METARPAGFSISTKVAVLLPVNSVPCWSHRPVGVFCCRLTNLRQLNRRRGQRRKKLASVLRLRDARHANRSPAKPGHDL